ncbi:MAG TPA: hypothetical protein VKQ32_16280 [Polyangia bacterium]|nr:hypothetical protein [Polyangia bacterium]
MNLFPLTVVQLMLVCFLLQISSATGEICCLPRQEIRVPAAVNGDELLPGPVVEISPTDLRVDGSVVDGGAALADRLLVLKNKYALLHPAETFEGRVVVWADRDVPWSRLREVLAAANKRDYLLVDFVVIK